MAAVDMTTVPTPAVAEAKVKMTAGRALSFAASVVIPLIIWFLPLDMAANAKGAIAISSFMIIAWMTNVMEYGATGLIGCLLFWAFNVVKIDSAFSGFVTATPWFLFGAILLGAAANKTGVPQRIGAFVVTNVGSSYSRLLLGLVITCFVLTPFVPSGSARTVIMASIAVGVINVFGVGKGSNIGRGIFLVITYTAAIFDKMMIAGAGAITAQGAIVKYGNVNVDYAVWFFAFLPCAILTIVSSWLLALWLFPPEVKSLEGRMDELKKELATTAPWGPMAKKSIFLSLGAIALWMTQSLHHIPPEQVALGVALIAFLPYVDVLNAEDMYRVNLLPVIFVGAAVSMGTVMQDTGALKIVAGSFFETLQPLLTNHVVAVPALYWGGFIYHFALASEISMLATSLPILMEFAKAQHLDPLWIGMVWSFSAGGKLFAYQSAPLVIGYSYGYFKHTDLIVIGALLTVIEFVGLALSVAFYWPFLPI